MVTKEAYFIMSVLVVTGGNMVFGIVYCIDSRGVDGVGNSGLYYRTEVTPELHEIVQICWEN